MPIPTPSELIPPFSVAIVRDPTSGVIESFVYGSDERATFEADVDDLRAAGYSVWATWKPVWADAAYKPQQMQGWFTDAYGNSRKVGNSDIVD
jgi:hypothetical protein